MYIADTFNFVIRKVTPAGVISTVVGNGTTGYTGDGGLATSAEIGSPQGMAFDTAGDLFFADYGSHVVREVNTSGIISTVAGTGTPGSTGDGGQATSAELNWPIDVVFNAAGDLFISDANANVIREVNTSGIISTVVGTGAAGYTGDGGQAASAELNYPFGMAFNSSGDLFIADYGNNVVREVNTAGVISTVAGNGSYGYSGDGGPATSAELNNDAWIVFDAFGDMFIDDNSNIVVREVSPSGIITTAVGSGSFGYAGNGGPAIASELYQPFGIALDSSGNLFIGDSLNNVIREVAAAPLLTYTVTLPPSTLPAAVSLIVNAGAQTTTYQADVATSLGDPVTGGTVSFYDGTTLLGVAPVVNGVALFNDSALSPGQHNLSAVFSGTETVEPGTASQAITVAATTGEPSLIGLSRYPLHHKRTLVSLFFNETLNPAEALWKHNFKLHNSYGDRIKVSHIYFDQPSSTVTLLPAHRIVMRNTYTLKLVGLNAKTGPKGSSPTVASTGWLANSFKAKINHKAFSLPGAPPAIQFVNGKEVARRS